MVTQVGQAVWQVSVDGKVVAEYTERAPAVDFAAGMTGTGTRDGFQTAAWWAGHMLCPA